VNLRVCIQIPAIGFDLLIKTLHLDSLPLDKSFSSQRGGT